MEVRVRHVDSTALPIELVLGKGLERSLKTMTKDNTQRGQTSFFSANSSHLYLDALTTSTLVTGCVCARS